MTRKHCTETGSPCIAQSLEFSFPLTARGTLSFQQPTAQLTFIRRLREFVLFALTPLARFPLRAYDSVPPFLPLSTLVSSIFSLFIHSHVL